MEEHGLSLRGQRPRTGLSHVTVQQMMDGVVPQMESVVAFARGFGLNVNEWLELAGYEPIRPTPRQILGEGLLALAEKHGRTVGVAPFEGLDQMTEEQARERIASIDAAMARGDL